MSTPRGDQVIVHKKYTNNYGLGVVEKVTPKMVYLVHAPPDSYIFTRQFRHEEVVPFTSERWERIQSALTEARLAAKQMMSNYRLASDYFSSRYEQVPS